MKSICTYMGSVKQVTLVIILSLFYTISLSSQTVKIENIQFYFDKSLNEVTITYDFKDFSDFERYEIDLIFRDGNNLTVHPKSVSGDIGKNVTGGINKIIKWNIFNDVDGLSETARPFITISSVGTVPLDPSMALIMNQIDKSNKNRFNFKFKRDGLMLIGAGTGIGAIVFKIKADNYIDQQKTAGNMDEYDLAGKNADKFYTWSKVCVGVSIVCVGVALYQYIRPENHKNKKQALYIVPGIRKGVSVGWAYNF